MIRRILLAIIRATPVPQREPRPLVSIIMPCPFCAASVDDLLTSNDVDVVDAEPSGV